MNLRPRRCIQQPRQPRFVEPQLGRDKWGVRHRGGTAHVDTYVTNVIGTLYLNNPNASPEQVAQFIDHRWGTHGEAVLDLLTTDTEVWTAELGVTVGVRSGARA